MGQRSDEPDVLVQMGVGADACVPGRIYRLAAQGADGPSGGADGFGQLAKGPGLALASPAAKDSRRVLAIFHRMRFQDYLAGVFVPGKGQPPYAEVYRGFVGEIGYGQERCAR